MFYYNLLQHKYWFEIEEAPVGTILRFFLRIEKSHFETTVK